MNRKFRHIDNSTSFIDLLFISTFIFIILFLLSMPIREIKQDGIDPKAEFLVQIEWDSDLNNDVDLFFLAPTGEAVSFVQKNNGIYNLERDDLGTSSDEYITMNGETNSIKINSEVLTMRGFTEGTYSASVFMYQLKDTKRPETKVKAKIYKMNPFKIIVEKTIILTVKGQEVTIANFTVDAEGNITELTDTYTPLKGVVGMNVP